MGQGARLTAGLALLAALSAACGGERAPSPHLTLAATTTVEDSGLLTAILEGYRVARPGVPTRAITGGTGEMLALARRGDVDLVISHDPAAESAFVAERHGAERRELMYNDFVILGPPGDPAGVHGTDDAAEALRRIARAREPFVSRGDDSGTHRKERALWRAAGVEPGGDWYLEAGTGMGDALRVADARGAYILTDRATYTVLRGRLALEPLVAGDPRLLNRYGIVRVAAPEPDEVATDFIDWLTGPEGQALIRTFGRDRFDTPLFEPADRTAP